MTVSFGGEVAAHYAAFRRGYPAPVLDALADHVGLGADDVVLDLGCGTGQLAIPLAARARAVVGMDPEPEMLRHARAAAERRGVRNVTWVLGADTDVPALAPLVGQHGLGLAVVGQALHWMDSDRLFPALAPLLRPGGGIAVVSNGTPLWLRATDWSRALRDFLQRRLGRPLVATCGTDAADRHRYARALTAAGYREVRQVGHTYEHVLDLDRLVGEILSAMPPDELPPPDERPAFAHELGHALGGRREFTETVEVVALTAVAPGA
ncbi:class I SAM-dependent methyltransferase [Streptomyces hainanensis]|uniref:Class I SAM-dependent methyltransferase n=1 Tax=Streptomyces hainanensis TaxID=402648 RepID=A0A4R4TK88_9ACTN|nr:class I SAM-dependent methyltransferase [Streptomyces hainanensis]TDC78160.1 class I SAM-dependent methyltransferase [Streptomyces hainanensis]